MSDLQSNSKSEACYVIFTKQSKTQCLSFLIYKGLRWCMKGNVMKIVSAQNNYYKLTINFFSTGLVVDAEIQVNYMLLQMQIVHIICIDYSCIWI
jgi:hypothetical protein